MNWEASLPGHPALSFLCSPCKTMMRGRPRVLVPFELGEGRGEAASRGPLPCGVRLGSAITWWGFYTTSSHGASPFIKHFHA